MNSKGLEYGKSFKVEFHNVLLFRLGCYRYQNLIKNVRKFKQDIWISSPPFIIPMACPRSNTQNFCKRSKHLTDVAVFLLCLQDSVFYFFDSVYSFFDSVLSVLSGL